MRFKAAIHDLNHNDSFDLKINPLQNDDETLFRTSVSMSVAYHRTKFLAIDR